VIQENTVQTTALMPLRYYLLLAVISVLGFSGWSHGQSSAKDDKRPKQPVLLQQKTDSAKVKKGWRPLFNGKDISGWKVTEFGGQGEVYVEDGDVVITQGADLSGIHTDRKLAGKQYEVEFEARRQAGSDFFVGFTFPVKDGHCSLILGGWGGGVCGVSSLEGMDASENETTTFMDFEKDKWYRVRVVVTDKKMDAWVDKLHLVDVETEGRRIDVRFEMERSKPFGFATYQTTGRIRNARIRDLSPKVDPQKTTGKVK
jgi:3-keto-disaccharide hydrolase